MSLIISALSAISNAGECKRIIGQGVAAVEGLVQAVYSRISASRGSEVVPATPRGPEVVPATPRGPEVVPATPRGPEVVSAAPREQADAIFASDYPAIRDLKSKLAGKRQSLNYLRDLNSQSVGVQEEITRYSHEIKEIKGHLGLACEVINHKLRPLRRVPNGVHVLVHRTIGLVGKDKGLFQELESSKTDES